MYFLLDKDYAIQNRARCIGISDKQFSADEIKTAKEFYNTTEIIIFIGDGIPHHIEYDPINNTIVEKVIVEETQDVKFMQEETQEESVFNEDVAVEPEVYYFYIDKNIADTEHRTETIATFTKPLLNPQEYFTKEVYEVKGKDVPFYVTVENGTIREATRYERCQRGQYKLQDREIEFKGDIIYLEEGWYIEGEELKKVPIPDGIKLEFNEETHTWEEKATDLEKVEDSLRKALLLNNCLDGKEMEEQNVFEDYRTYVSECKLYIRRAKRGFSALTDMPVHSQKLQDYFNYKKEEMV